MASRKSWVCIRSGDACQFIEWEEPVPELEQQPQNPVPLDVPTKVEISNVLHRLNLQRPDIAALPEGASMVCNITTLRQADAPKRYTVELRYTYHGRGYTTIEVEADSPEEAENLAKKKFCDSPDIDGFDTTLDDCDAERVTQC